MKTTLTEEQLRLMQEDAATERMSVIDRAYWPRNERDEAWVSEPRNYAWVQAFEAVDNKFDPNPLVLLLRSDLDMPTGDYLLDLLQRHGVPPLAERLELASALERHSFTKPRGRPKTPAYDRSLTHSRILDACEEVKERSKGVSVEAAVAEVADRFGISTSTLRDAYAGKHRATRNGGRRLLNVR